MKTLEVIGGVIAAIAAVLIWSVIVVVYLAIAIPLYILYNAFMFVVMLVTISVTLGILGVYRFSAFLAHRTS